MGSEKNSVLIMSRYSSECLPLAACNENEFHVVFANVRSESCGGEILRPVNRGRTRNPLKFDLRSDGLK